MKITIKERKQMITELIGQDIDNWTAQDTDSVCRKGCKGYENMTDNELIVLYKDTFIR